MGELYLRHTQRFADYQERNGEPRIGHKTEIQNEPWLWTLSKDAHWKHHLAEFDQDIESNSLGLIGKLRPGKKQPREVRIVAIGDSYTMGAGDTLGYGYPSILERNLNSGNRSRTYTVINAGVWGSDPIFGINLLQLRLWTLHPDIVLLTINYTDIDDLVRRGALTGSMRRVT